MHALTHLVFISITITACSARERVLFDDSWLFQLGEVPGFEMCSPNQSFPIDMTFTQCQGLTPAGIMSDEDACMSMCCSSSSCQTYEYCPPGSTTCTPGDCWYGYIGGECTNATEWVGRGRTSQLPPPVFETGPTTAGFNDSQWRPLTLPHDFVVEGTYVNISSLMDHGYLQPNISWYRKHFYVNASWQGNTIWLDFDGIYRASDVWLNGVWLGHHDSGYTSFRYYIHNATNASSGQLALNFGSTPNVLAVRVDARDFEGWWYEGGGIYRHVWINQAAPLFIIPWSLYTPSFVSGTITSPNGSQGAQTASAALYNVQVDIYYGNASKPANTSFFLILQILDADGVQVGLASANSTAAGGQWQRIQIPLAFNPGTTVNLWNTAAPYLYSVVASIQVGGTIIDQEIVATGVRSAIFDPNNGLVLNGYPVKIRGICQHQDFAGCGIALPDRINLLRVQKLQHIGVNAWRMSHNPPNPELLDMLDAAGFLVVVENRNFINQSQYLVDAADMVLRDRNHPSVILWSMCNEYECAPYDDASSILIGALFKNVIQSTDWSRPITAAIRNDGSTALNSEFQSGVANALDVMGVNYDPQVPPLYHQMRPWKAIIGTESASCQTDRDVLTANYTAGYVGEDFYTICTPANGQQVAMGDFYAGAFAWTGFDYRGEPNPLQWPDISAHFGIMDTCGFFKQSAHYYDIWWANNASHVHMYPHWTRPGMEGQSNMLYVYSSAAVVEVFVNGASQGKQNMPLYGSLQYNVVYEPGNVTAVGYDVNGTAIANGLLLTTSSPARLGVLVEAGADGIQADGMDTAFLTLAIFDANGLLVQYANNNVTVSVTGPGEIYGFGNGDPASHEADKFVTWRSAFNGLLCVLIRSTSEAGTIVVTASSPGLQPAQTSFQAL
jgi:beta-galactosidase